MKRTIRLCAAFIFTCFALTSCSDDDGKTSKTSVEEDKKNIKAAFDNLSQTFEDTKNGDFYKFLSSLLKKEEYVKKENGYYYDYIFNEDTYEYDFIKTPYTYEYIEEDYSYFIRDLWNKLDKVVGWKGFENNRFKYNDYRGKYTWNKSNREWTKSSNSTISFYFPSDSVRADNNCELNLTNYSDQACNIEGDYTYLPTAINVVFNKDKVNLAKLNFSAKYNSYGIPQNAELALYAHPLNANITLKQESSAKFYGNFTLENKKNGSQTNIEARVVLSNTVNKYTDFSDIELRNIQATVKQDKMTIRGSIDLSSIIGKSPTISDINKSMNFEVLYDNQKVGTLKAEEVSGERAIFIVYKDGPEENTNMLYDEFLSEMKGFFKENN